MARKTKDEAAPAAETTFEQDLERLEALVAELEDGDLPLERALALFEEGTVLGRRCGRRLDDVERKITVLVERSDGTLDETDFEPEAAAKPAGQPAGKAVGKPADPPAASKGTTSARGGSLFDDGDADTDGVPF